MSHHLVPHLTRVCGWSGELLRQAHTQTLHLHDPPFGTSLDKGVWLEWRTTASSAHTDPTSAWATIWYPTWQGCLAGVENYCVKHTHRPYIYMSRHLVPHLTRVFARSGELLRQTHTQTLHLHEPPFGNSLDKGVRLEWRTTALSAHTDPTSTWATIWYLTWQGCSPGVENYCVKHTHRPYIYMSHHLVPHLTRVFGWSGELQRQTHTQTLHLHEPPFGTSLDKAVRLEWRTTALNTHTDPTSTWATNWYLTWQGCSAGVENYSVKHTHRPYIYMSHQLVPHLTRVFGWSGELLRQTHTHRPYIYIYIYILNFNNYCLHSMNISMINNCVGLIMNSSISKLYLLCW